METIEKLKKDFEDFAIQQNVAAMEGNGSKANRFHKKIQKLYERTKILGYTNMFKDFLYNENESVRIWAATFCLKQYPEIAKEVLTELTKSSKPIISLSAKSILESFHREKWNEIII